MTKYFILILLIGAGCMACSSYKVETVVYTQIDVDTTYQENESISAIIQPYQDSLKEEMNKIIGSANADFFKERPSGDLGNLVADITKLYGLKTLKTDLSLPCISLINNGGLRSPISAGNITVGDVFKLMPFDNTLVILTFEGEVLYDILNYLEKRGGEPVSGLFYNGFYFQVENLSPNETPENFQLITTDYLANGGDDMTFMEKNIKRENTDILLRDAIIQFITEKQEIKLEKYKDNRLSFDDE